MSILTKCKPIVNKKKSWQGTFTLIIKTCSQGIGLYKLKKYINILLSICYAQNTIWLSVANVYISDLPKFYKITIVCISFGIDSPNMDCMENKWYTLASAWACFDL